MHVFLSWSGEPAKSVAKLLMRWLPLVLQEVEPWISDDISPGKKWSREIEEALEKSIVGIIVVMRMNENAPWLNFEAGAIAKHVKDSTTRAIPYCLDMKPGDLRGPLGLFHGVEADREGTLKMVKSVNAVLKKPLPEPRLEQTFDLSYKSFANELAAILALAAKDSTNAEKPAARPDSEKIEEVLQIVRELRNDKSQFGQPGVVLSPGPSAPLSEAEQDAIMDGRYLQRISNANRREYRRAMDAVGAFEDDGDTSLLSDEQTILAMREIEASSRKDLEIIARAQTPAAADRRRLVAAMLRNVAEAKARAGRR